MRPDIESLDTRLDIYRLAMAEGWKAYFETYVPQVLGGVYDSAQQADMTLLALGIAAGRWATSPTKRPRRSSRAGGIPGMQSLIGEGRDAVRLAMLESMANAFHQQFCEMPKVLDTDQDVVAMLVTLSLSAVRDAAALAFIGAASESTTLATLDQHLREHLPAGVTWWEAQDPVWRSLLG